MFVVPYHTLINAMGLDFDAEHAADDVTISRALFRHMLTLLLERSDFDEEAYLAAYPDVANSVALGGCASGREHFARIGYFEGRTAGSIRLDADYYREQNPDVDQTPEGARRHYYALGLYEWRAPSAEAAQEMGNWRNVIGQERARAALRAPSSAASPEAAASTPAPAPSDNSILSKIASKPLSRSGIFAKVLKG